MFVFWIAVALLAGLAIGVSLGSVAAQKSAVYHADCSTAHHMLGGFYYIVPESEYVRTRWRTDGTA